MNQLVLTACIVERAAMRFTPAGLPAVDVRLAHDSEVLQDGQPRRISFEMPATAVGEPARRLEQLAVGTTVEVHGFLGKLRNGRGVLLHIQRLDRLTLNCNVSDS